MIVQESEYYHEGENSAYADIDYFLKLGKMTLIRSLNCASSSFFSAMRGRGGIKLKLKNV